MLSEAQIQNASHMTAFLQLKLPHAWEEMCRSDFTGIMKSPVDANNHRVSLPPITEAKYVAQGRLKLFLIGPAMIYQSPVSQGRDSLLAKERDDTVMSDEEEVFNGSDFPAHTFTLSEEFTK